MMELCKGTYPKGAVCFKEKLLSSTFSFFFFLFLILFLILFLTLSSSLSFSLSCGFFLDRVLAGVKNGFR